jgi:hypothetical protein
MAILLRVVNGTLIAICAACSVPKEGDVYLDDGQHSALSDKFARDFNSMFDLDIPYYPEVALLVEQEESNNENRVWWDKTYGKPGD